MGHAQLGRSWVSFPPNLADSILPCGLHQVNIARKQGDERAFGLDSYAARALSRGYAAELRNPVW